MVFSSNIFLFVFLPITLVFYYFCKDKYRNNWLLLVSLFFYSWGEPRNILIMLLSIVINYIFALLIDKTSNVLWKKITLCLVIFFNLGMLFYYKYFDFCIENVNALFSSEIALRNIALPIGISFFTFQGLSYVVDVYRKDTEVQKNILSLGLYISLFPQLIAGPIVRYIDVAEQINNRSTSIEKSYEGIRRFIFGFSKKVLIADQLAPLVDVVFAQNGSNALCAWIGAIAYSLQIYYDFSGYSDMAIGLGLLFGFEFRENFNYPYISRSIKEFWRRWHISLSTWFRDYVYIPLGGSRCKKGRAYVNLAIVFFLTGFWHGASWNFIAWGLYYAVFLILERVILGKILERIPVILQRFYTIFVLILGWVLFRAETLQHAVVYIKNMFWLEQDSWKNFVYIMDRQYIFTIIIGVLLSIPWAKKVGERLSGRFLWVRDLSLIVLFVLAISYMMGSGFSPFLYFRF